MINNYSIINLNVSEKLIEKIFPLKLKKDKKSQDKFIAILKF